MRFNKSFFCIIILVFCGVVNASGISSPEGIWRTARSELRLYEVNGELRGDVSKILTAKGNSALCDKCQGSNHNKPLLGMTVLTGLRFKDDKWVGGKVLDPDTGDLMNCTLSVSKDGKTIEFRPSKGLFSKTLTWERL